MKLKLLLAASFATSLTFGSLVPLGVIPSTGNGLGAVNTIVTFQNTGTEVGCVGFNGTTKVIGSSQCFGIGAQPTTNEQTAAGQNVYTAADLGITSGGSRTFANLILIFNGSEGGNATDQLINLTNLSLNLFSASGGLLPGGSFTTTQSYTYTALPGTGNAGFAFQLDAAQAAAANALLAANSSLRIGASARATDANSGLETVSVSSINTVQPGGGGSGSAVPEPSTYLMLAGGLIALSQLRKTRFLN